MSELHLKQPQITVVLVDHSINIVKELKIQRNRKFKIHIEYELDKACFAQDAAYPDSKDLTTRAISDKTLKDRVYEIARNLKYDDYERALASMV